MINEHLKPVEEIFEFVPKSDKHDKLRIHICIYNQPKMTTGEHTIFSVIEIKEKDEKGEYNKLFSQLFYEKILTDQEILERITLIKQNPFNFKVKRDEQS